MTKSITRVGIDDHKLRLTVAVTPRRVGRRVKTDPIDARKLVQLFRSEELVVVATPSEGDEAARDLVRTYHRVVAATRKRRHILKFLIRRGRIYREWRWSMRALGLACLAALIVDLPARSATGDRPGRRILVNTGRAMGVKGYITAPAKVHVRVFPRHAL